MSTLEAGIFAQTQQHYQQLSKTHRLSEKQTQFVQEVITLAANETVDLSRQEQKYVDLIFKKALSLPNSITDNKIKTQAKETWQTIENFFKAEREASDRLYKQEKQEFINEVDLHKDSNKNRIWLTNTHIAKLMPNDTNAFKVLTPIRTTELSAIDIKKYLEDSEVKSIVIPVGPGHWRLINIKKEVTDNQTTLVVTMFDSFGTNSAETIKPIVTNWLGFQTNLPITIRYDSPTIPQSDGFSCGDFITAKTHQYAKKAGAPHESVFVNALETGLPLRPLMIKKSENPDTVLPQPTENKWFSFRKEKPTAEVVQKTKEPIQEDVITYHHKDGTVKLISKERQIELDEQLARELQDEWNTQDYRTGPK